MKLKKNWFYFLTVLFAVMGMLYIFAYSFVSLAKNFRNGYLMQGGVFLVLLGIWLFLHLAVAAGRRFKLEEKLSRDKAWVRWAEAVIVTVVLVLAVGIRLWMIGQMPQVYLQEHKDYYDIALALFQDSSLQSNSRYCDLIADSPSIMGYSYLLMKAFKVWGEGIKAGRYLNVIFAAGGAFTSYKIARKTGGRMAGITALLLCAFWPSRILAVNILSGEHAFLFLVLLCIWIFLSLIMDYDEETPDGMQAVLLYIVLGVFLAVSAAISALSAFLLLAMLIFLLPRRMKLPAKPVNDIPLMVRALRWGWIRCILILIPYVISAVVISSNIELTIDRDVSFSKIACGSSLMEEMNENFIEEKSSKKLKFFADRFIKLSENDDSDIEDCKTLLETQESMSREQKDYFDRISAFNQAVYTATAFLSLLCLFFLLYKEASPAFLLVLLLLILGATSFFTGTESEFQFMMPQIFILFGAAAIGYTFGEGWRTAVRFQADKELQEKDEQMEAFKLQLFRQEEEKMAELRKEAYANVFDMKKALQEGHVIMTVSEIYGKEEESSSRGQITYEPAQEYEERPVEGTGKGKAGSSVEREDGLDKDDFDWQFTEEELNSLVDQNWAAVRELVDKKSQEILNNRK